MTRFSAQTNDKAVGMIYSTKNYSKFKIDKRNRPVNIGRAMKLYKELLNNPDLTIEPIVVNHNYTIIDGQHRFWAIRKAKQELFWYMDNNLTIKDAILLNSKGKHWSALDYISAYANSGFIDYQALMKNVKLFDKDVSLTVIITLMKKSRFPTNKRLAGGLSSPIRSGNYQFDFEKEKTNQKFLEYLASLKGILGIKPSQTITRKVANAIKIWYFNPAVNKRRLSKLLSAQWRLSLTVNDDMNAINLGKLYNRRLTSNKIDYYTDMNGKFHFQGDDK